jgi:natural product precursor
MKKNTLKFEKFSDKLTKKEMISLKGGDTTVPGETYNPKTKVYDVR